MRKIPSRNNHELALLSLQNIKERTFKNSAFFRKSSTLSASFDPKRRFLWKSMNPFNQPLGKHLIKTKRSCRCKCLSEPKNTQEVGFLLQLYNPVSEFWTETEISLKITEPNQPATRHHVRATNYFQFVGKCFPKRKHSRSWLPFANLKSFQWVEPKRRVLWNRWTLNPRLIVADHITTVRER